MDREFLKNLIREEISRFIEAGTDNPASREARKLGLKHIGYGNYADPKTGLVTHKSTDKGQKLVPVQKQRFAKKDTGLKKSPYGGSDLPWNKPATDQHVDYDKWSTNADPAYPEKKALSKIAWKNAPPAQDRETGAKKAYAPTGYSGPEKTVTVTNPAVHDEISDKIAKTMVQRLKSNPEQFKSPEHFAELALLAWPEQNKGYVFPDYKSKVRGLYRQYQQETDPETKQFLKKALKAAVPLYKRFMQLRPSPSPEHPEWKGSIPND